MIRMSKLTDYAIVLLAHLARAPGTLTAQELAAAPGCRSRRSRSSARSSRRPGSSPRTAGGTAGTASPAPPRQSPCGDRRGARGPHRAHGVQHPGPQTAGSRRPARAKATWDPVSRAIQGALANLPLSRIAPFRAPGGEAPAEGAVVTLGAHAS